MKKIAVLGIGRSSHYLLEYLNRQAPERHWQILACDLHLAEVEEKITAFEFISARELNIENAESLASLISDCDLVISLLPPALHIRIAKVCLALSKHLATASYVSSEMRELDTEARKKELIFINEAGLDPGIDHMSAMKILDALTEKGASVFSFESYCGGLIMEEDCTGNPWKYKFSWNPMNVILAGQGGDSRYKKNGNLHVVPWHQVFAEAEQLNIPELGSFDAYINRDSLSYTEIYGLQSTPTFVRGTLRRLHFCQAWNVLVQLGFTDNVAEMDDRVNTFKTMVGKLTGATDSIKFSDWLLQNQMISQSLVPHFDFLEKNADSVLLSERTAAGKLLQLLGNKWKLEPQDRDEVVMYHRIGYELEGKQHWIESTLRIPGLDSRHTAMAKTVGLPLAMAAESILSGNIQNYGVQIPTSKIWYDTILPKLEAEDVVFSERHN